MDTCCGAGVQVDSLLLMAFPCGLLLLAGRFFRGFGVLELLCSSARLGGATQRSLQAQMFHACLLLQAHVLCKESND